jgi:hypothetical protein
MSLKAQLDGLMMRKLKKVGKKYKKLKKGVDKQIRKCYYI